MLLKGALSAPFCLVQRSRRVNVQVTVAFLVCIYEQAGANVEIDGLRWQHAVNDQTNPSTHTIVVKKPGCKPWERQMAVSDGHIDGHINVVATLESQ